MSSPFPLGALVEPGGTRFRVYAPDARRVELVLEAPQPAATIVMTPAAGGVHAHFAAGVGSGARYRYRLDGGPPFPDPVSRFQPLGVHGPSEVIDPRAFAWQHETWPRQRLAQMVIYELHVGTFTRAGTFAAAAERLEYLRDVGVTAVELMPLHEFPGNRNWGYDTAALFAPPRCYGHPDDLRRFIDTAHGLGLVVLLDVVYNHLGPDGAYVAAFDRALLNHARRTPWGSTLDFDGPRSHAVRELVIENALYWQREFRVDGFRLDAIQAIHDSSEPHLLAELTARLHAASGERGCVVIGEDHRNLAHVIRHRDAGGHGLDGLWGMDLHHQYHRVLTGERELYYRVFRASARDLARAINDGWIFTGQHDAYHGEPRGGDAAGVEPWRIVAYLQSHDEVGNRPLGDRLHAVAGLPAYRAALALLLLGSQTPMLFMGDEWAASTPFHFFTDHKESIGAKVTRGRLDWIGTWRGYRGPRGRKLLSDPQAPATFESSRLDWGELEHEPHAAMLRWVRRLLALRREEPALRAGADGATFEARALGRRGLLLRCDALNAPGLRVIAQLAGGATVRVPKARLVDASAWDVATTSEDVDYATDASPPIVHFDDGAIEVTFSRPGAVILRRVDAQP